VTETALTLLSALRQALSEETRTLTLLRSRLRSVSQHLMEMADRLLDSEAGLQVMSIDLADLPYRRQLYQDHVPPLEQTLVTLLNDEDLTAWGDLNVDDIAARLCAAASPPFRAIAELTVEDVLVNRAAEMSPQARKELLLHMATPSWNLDATRLEDGGAHLKNILVMGVRDEGHSIYRDDAHMLASTRDPDSVIIFSATIGAPFTALQRYPEYERVYEAVRHVRPLHVLPQFQSDSDQARLAFALGTIFDMIFNRGRYFYYRPADELDPPLKLGNGLANALYCFGSTDSLVQEVMDRVERHIEAIGTARAIEILSAYYTRSGEGEVSSGGTIDSIVIEMRKLVRAYTQDLRQTQWVMGSG